MDELDVLIVPETQATDNVKLPLLAKGHGLHTISSLRPCKKSRFLRRPWTGGGIAVFARRSITISTVARHPSGDGMCITIRRRGYLPIYAICLYVPTDTSSYGDQRQPLLAWAIALHTSLTGRHGNRVLIAGDMNSRLGGEGRHTEDDDVPPARRRDISHLCHHTGTWPAHGRTSTHPAVSTSRHHSGSRSELDYILTGKDANFFTPLPSWAWDDARLPEQTYCHRHVAVHCTLLRSDEHHKAARPSPLHIPHYSNSDAWSRAARHLGTSSAANADTIQREWQIAASTCLAEPDQSARSRTYKAFQGVQLPLHLRRDFTLARERNDPELTRATYASAKQHLRGTLRDLTRRASHLRATDAHGHATLLRRMTGLHHASTPHIGEEGGVPAEERFTAHYKALLTEDRPPLRGAHDDHQRQFIPRTGSRQGPDLAREITAGEVYQVIWPLRKGEHLTRCGDDCSECDVADAALRDWTTGLSRTRPPQTPILRASRSPGPDAIPAELLLFARLTNADDERDRRSRLCLRLATALNDMLLTGRASAQTMACSTTPVPKSTPGVSTDDYRGVTCSGIISKIFSLVLTRRTTHWALHHNLIDEAQAGFLYRRSADLHAWTLLETLRFRRRQKLGTCAMFVDLRKAYDKVPLTALWDLLTHMGAPATYVNALRGLASIRTTAVKVNGSVSPAFSVSAGVPQGDPLSCVLFLLFIEPLSRSLDALPEAGIRVGELRLSRLLFADDVVVLFARPHDAQSIAHVISAWCSAWGAEVGTGTGKTEAMYFAVATPGPQDAPYPGLPTISIGQGTCPWVTSYKYLGVRIQHDLRHGSQRTKMLQTLRQGYHDDILRSPLMRDYAPLGVQLQRLGQISINASCYARGVLPTDAATNTTIDSTTLKIARGLLHLPEGTSMAATWALSRLLPADAIEARERERLLLTMTLTPTPGLPTRVLAALASEPPSSTTTKGDGANWLHQTLLLRAEHAAHGATYGAPLCHTDIPASAHVYGRAVAATIITRRIDGKRTQNHAPATIYDHGSGKHAEAMTDDWAALREPQSLGECYGHTPVTAFGPGCSGALPALSMYHRYPATVALSLGNEALERWPFTPAGQRAVDYASRFEDRACPACAAPRLSLAHVVNECSAEAVRGWRDEYDRHTHLRLRRIVTSAADIAGTAYPPDIAPAPADTPFIRPRLLAGRPWTRDSAPLNAATSSDAGAVFQNLSAPHHLIREWADAWLQNSERSIHALAEAWRRAAPA